MLMQKMIRQPAEGLRIWLPGIIENIARFVSPNEIACTWRLLDKATSQQFLNFRTVRLSLASPAPVFKLRWGSPYGCRSLTFQQRRKLLCLTAASGSLPNLEVALDSAGLVPVGALLEAAAGAGQLEACQLLLLRGCPWADSLAAAARGGHRHVCEWALASGCPLTSDAAYAAARGGHEGLMRWLLQLLREGDGAASVGSAKLLTAVAEGLGLEALQRLYQQELPAVGQQQQQQPGGGGGEAQQAVPDLDLSEKVSLLAAAACSPSHDWQAKVEWLEGLGCPRSAVACMKVTKMGRGGDTVGRLRWLMARGYCPDRLAVSAAAFTGDSAALRFLLGEAGLRLCAGVELHLADQGDLAMLQYLHALTDHPCTTMVVTLAARGGHLPLVVWTVEVMGMNPGVNPHLLEMAATSGNIELMAWLRDRGWAWGDNAITSVAFPGCEEALEWALAQGCPWREDDLPYRGAVRRGDLAMVRCLHRLGCPWGRSTKLLADCIRHKPPAPIPALRLLVELGCPVDWGAVQEVAEAEQPGEYRTALLAWLDEERRQR